MSSLSPRLFLVVGPRAGFESPYPPLALTYDSAHGLMGFPHFSSTFRACLHLTTRKHSILGQVDVISNSAPALMLFAFERIALCSLACAWIRRLSTTRITDTLVCGHRHPRHLLRSLHPHWKQLNGAPSFFSHLNVTQLFRLNLGPRGLREFLDPLNCTYRYSSLSRQASPKALDSVRSLVWSFQNLAQS